MIKYGLCGIPTRQCVLLAIRELNFSANTSGAFTLGRLNFIIVTRKVPPSTSSNEGVLTKVAADPPKMIDASTTLNAPIKPINVATSKAIVSVHSDTRKGQLGLRETLFFVTDYRQKGPDLKRCAGQIDRREHH